MSFFKNKKVLIPVLAAAAALCITLAAVLLFSNGSEGGSEYFFDFEEGREGFSGDGYTEGASEFIRSENGGVEGSACLAVINNEENDARFYKEFTLKKGKYYKLETDVKVENVSAANFGANISVLESSDSGYSTINGGDGWTHLENYVYSSETKAYKVCLRLGYYGSTVTGTAYFDNVKITELSKLPSGASALNLTAKKTTTTTADAEYDEGLYYDMRIVTWLISGFVLIAFLLVYRYIKINGGLERETASSPAEPFKIKKGSIVRAVCFAATAALLLRILLSITYFQCNIDVGLFKYWGRVAVDEGIGELYNVATNCDYPPLYMYFMAAAVWINRLLGNSDTVLTLLVKLPSILADISIGIIIYVIAKKERFSDAFSKFIMCLWLFNPCVLVDSACWGQVDSLLALLVVLCCVFANNDRWLLSGLMFGLGVMLKPQMIIFLPVFGCVWFFHSFLEKITEKRVGKAFATLGFAMLGTVLGLILPCIPFFGMESVKIGILGKEFTAPWIFSLFIGTVDHYSYATVNYYNFWFLLGKNWEKDDLAFGGLTYYKWGMLAIVIISLIVVICFAVRYILASLQKSEKALQSDKGFVYLAGTAMYFAVSCFGPRMHERYFFPGIALLLIAMLYFGRKRMLISYGLASAFGFVSVHEIMMGLLVGSSVSGAGGDGGDFYWPSLTDYRGFLAAFITVSAIISLGYAIWGAVPKKQKMNVEGRNEL